MAGRHAGNVVTRYAGVQVQTSAMGVNIPVGWGTFRCKCNLLDYLDFKSTPQKGGGKGGSPTTGYSYAATIILGICEGPIDRVENVYVNSNTYVNGSKTALAQANLNLATGAIGQAVWSYLTSRHPDHAIGYSGIAYAYQSNFALDGGATPPNHSFEIVRVSGFGPVATSTGDYDVDPSLVVTDFFQNTRTGVPSWKTGLLGDMTPYQTYCLAAGLVLSPVIDQQRSASEFLNEVLKATNSTCVWSEGLLKFIPYGDTPITGNGRTYVPPITPVYILNDDAYVVEKESPPVLVDVEDQSDAYNVIQLEYLDRTNQYNMAIALASDAANVAQYGMRRKDPTTAHVICDPQVAAISAQLLLQRTLYIRSQFKFKLGWMYALLEPGDILQLNDSALGLTNYPVRVTQIDQDEKYGLSLVCEDYPVGIAHTPLFVMQNGVGYVSASTTPPGSAATPLLINPPPSLTGGAPEIWLATSGGANWGGAEVWVSIDGTDYQFSGTINGSNRYGFTTTALPVGGDPDTVHSLGVDLTTSGGTLTSATQSAANAGVTLCLIDNELIAYETATLTGANTYTLTYLRRGLLGTAIASHASSAPFVRLDGTLYEYPYLLSQANTPFYVKLPSFNLYGLALESLAAVPAYSITPSGLPAPGAGSWTASGTTVGGATGTSPLLIVTGAVDEQHVQSVIIEYRQVINLLPTYGPWVRYEAPATATTIPIDVGTAGRYQVQVHYKALNGVENVDAYLDLGTVVVGAPLGAPLPGVTSATTTYVAGITQISWTPVSDYRNPDYEIRIGASWAGGVVLARTTNPTLTSNGDGNYWIMPHFAIPNGGGDVYAAAALEVVISGSQLLANVVASHDEGAATPTAWSGTLTNLSMMTGFLEPASGHTGGSYTIPTGHRVNVGRVAACNVAITTSLVAQSVNNNVLTLTNILAVPDIFDSALGNLVNATPQIRLSQDGVTWGPWTNWSAGAYLAMAFDFQIIIASSDPAVIPVLEGFAFEVDVPDLIQTYTNQALASGGSTFTFASPFNGGPGSASVPNVQVTILNASPGDDVIASATLTSVTVQVKNGGSGVARNVNIIAQGY